MTKKPYSFKKATTENISSILCLLNNCALPAEDIPRENQYFWVLEKDHEVAGVIGLENYGLSGLLRSFAVRADFRSRGIGAGLLDHAVGEAGALGMESLYLCTDTAARYFENHSWIYIRRESVSEQVQQSEEFRSAWSADTSCMFLPLREGPVKQAIGTFLSGFNCAQSVFSSFATTLGLGWKESLKIASGFGAGICNKGEVCGAVSGAYMALGLKYGRYRSDDTEAKEKTYALMKELDAQFINRNGSLYCNHLLDGDMSTPEGRKVIQETHRFKTHCPRFVKDAAEITAHLMVTHG